MKAVPRKPFVSRIVHRVCPAMAVGLIAVLLGALPMIVTAADPPKDLPEPELKPAADPARFEEDIQAFEAEDKKNPPPKGAILFAGSSSILKWPLGESFPAIQTINRGFGGSQMADLLHFTERIIWPYDPSAIVVYEGDNDIAAGLGPERVRDHFRLLVRKIREDEPDTPIVFLSIKPSPARWELWPNMQQANAMIRRICKGDKTLHFVDVGGVLLGDDGQPNRGLFVEDGLHLNKTGYQRWVEVVRPAIMPFVKKDSDKESGKEKDKAKAKGDDKPKQSKPAASEDKDKAKNNDRDDAKDKPEPEPDAPANGSDTDAADAAE